MLLWRISTTFLLYSLIARGNFVNITSLFYLFPGVTAAMDRLFLGNPMRAVALAGLALIVAGLLLVFCQQRSLDVALPRSRWRER